MMLKKTNIDLSDANVLPLVTEPDQRLHKVSELIDKIDCTVQKLLRDMLVTTYHHNGIGLTAVQVGVMLKAIVIDIDQYNTVEKLHNDQPIFMINAEVIKASKEKYQYCEACLSLPYINANVERPAAVTVKYLDYYGKAQEKEFANNLLAVCVQHEIDHSNGIVFTDYLSKFKRTYLTKKMLKKK